MKKIIFLSLIVFLFVNCGLITRQIKKSSSISTSNNFNPEKYKRIAIIPFNTNKPERYNFIIADSLATSMMKIGFTVLERNRLEAIFRELNIELTGLISQADMNRIGKLSKIDALVMGSLEYDGGQGGYWYLVSGNMRMVDLTTGELIMSIYSNAYNTDTQFVVDDFTELLETNLRRRW